ncbi:tRNA-binding protein [Legionella bononiensis]|uniref:tRNA-binding protein n=1 Tax=Legionella bononiensis TaxID=2793102 RepID=A0ABS1W8Y3_9GAMM|nr:tRNA-binding protein [Legionella bononiensis]MBL7479781.1 tRNA-binding protein [Legionella bononiensis]MBL7525705.1 tRNA-binding protein [Legionella bononiensis]MBL7561888.1 tRNA-binding protein [Legionella bononiensis]
MLASYEDFEKIELRSGTVVKVEEFLRAKKPAYKVWVDFGKDIGVLQTSAQVTVHYTPETLLGRSVVGCVNLGEKNIAGFISQFLLVGFSDEQGAICLITTDPKVPNGQKLH